jgi:hypothetical protein
MRGGKSHFHSAVKYDAWYRVRTLGKLGDARLLQTYSVRVRGSVRLLCPGLCSLFVWMHLVQESKYHWGKLFCSGQLLGVGSSLNPCVRCGAIYCFVNAADGAVLILFIILIGIWWNCAILCWYGEIPIKSGKESVYQFITFMTGLISLEVFTMQELFGGATAEDDWCLELYYIYLQRVMSGKPRTLLYRLLLHRRSLLKLWMMIIDTWCIQI